MSNQSTGSKWNSYDNEIKKILEENEGIEPIAVVNKFELGLDMLGRQAFSKYIRRNAKRISDTYEGSYEVSDAVNMPSQDVPHYWDKRNKDFSVFVKNPNYIKPVEEEKIIKEIDFLSIFKDKIQAVSLNPILNFKPTSLFDRLVYTDVHIGMDVNPDTFSLYGGVWDEKEIFRRLDIMIAHTIFHKKSNVLHIDELGDFVDGWDGETTRKGHKLPQNMDNQGQFDTGFKFKIYLVEGVVNHFDKVICYDICEDNHAGAFGYVINSAFKAYIELKYPNNVTVTNQRKFIDHYFATPKHCFLLTHGKDSKSLKFGFKPILDKAQENKIDNYIKEYYLLQKGVKIEFGKGDSHQYLIDNSTSRSFSYNNFPAFSPPSGWVQVNFQKSMSGFVHYNYYDNGQKSTNDHIFKE